MAGVNVTLSLMNSTGVVKNFTESFPKRKEAFAFIKETLEKEGAKCYAISVVFRGKKDFYKYWYACFRHCQVV